MGNKSSRPASVKKLLSDMAARGLGSMETTDGYVKQWVDRVTNFSSQYDSSNWCADMVKGSPSVYPNYGDVPGAWAPGEIDAHQWNADQIIGQPKVFPAYGDKPGAWASKIKDAHQFIEVRFKEAVFVTGIEIYETYHAGGVKAILGKTDSGKWQTLYKRDNVEVIKTSQIFSPKLKEMDCKSRDIRIEIDCTKCGTWVELDAVELIGKIFRAAPPPSMEVLADNLQLLINDQRFSDVEFSVEGKSVYGHKAILSVRSDYFRAMFSNQMVETRTKCIELKDVPYQIIISVMHYLYTNRIPNIHEGITLTELWRAADRFSLEGLKTLASFTLSEKIDETNVVDIYVSASSKLPVIDEIKENCLSYMSSNMSKIVNTPSFVDLPQETMLEIVQATTMKLQLN